MKDSDKKIVGEGIFEQIRKMPVYKPEPLTPESLEQMFKDLQERDIAQRKRIAEMEKAHTKHFAERALELGEEPPLWLMVITAPQFNMINGGHFVTGAEFLKDNEKWLKDYNK